MILCTLLVSVWEVKAQTPIKTTESTQKTETAKETDKKETILTGIMLDDTNMPVIGGVVTIKGTATGTATGLDGRYELKIPAGQDQILMFSYMGMKTQEIKYTGQKTLNVTFSTDAEQVEEVVVTGYFTRKMDSFTGSASSFTTKEMKTTGSQNVLQALGTLDPSFKIAQNSMFGSDPNKMPDIEVRGKTSIVGMKEKYGTDPNQPLFIMDGFEVTMQVVNDLNMERVASVTILKDAASTAIYGSKAANGVIVIETKRPEAGKLSITYTGDFGISTPVLSDYNLMNATEKLEFERLAGVYRPKSHVENDPSVIHLLNQTYNDRLYNINSGVNTDWLAVPLRIGFSNKHNAYVEGGDEALRYGIGLSNNNVKGVMKGSDRNAFAGNIDLIYRKGAFSFSNKLTIDNINYSNPVVQFNDYVKTSPYYAMRDKNGKLTKFLEENDDRNPSKINIYNPAYQSSLNNQDKTSSFGIRNNFQAEWKITEVIRLKGRLGLTKTGDQTEYFLSPEHSSFEQTTDPGKLGSYKKSIYNNFSYDGDVTLTWGQLFGDYHRINAVGGWTFFQNDYTTEAFTATGFPGDEISNPSFANQYLSGGKPEYSHAKSRSTSFFANVGYSYDDRYLVDANIRMDGSSVFGSDKMFTTTWSVGLSWNIHNEQFIKKHGFFNSLKLRASIGNPGNQNFGGYNSFTSYVYNTGYSNYLGLGAIVAQWGNPDLEWQKTLDLNIGADIAILNNRLKFNIDVFRKLTNPLLVVAGVASSTGKTEFTTNVGKQLTKGVNATVYYSPIMTDNGDFVWTLSLNGSFMNAEYLGIGNSLDGLNESQRGSSLTRYYDGASPTAIWAVRSKGIDHNSGREVFFTKDGNKTFDYNYSDEVVVGNTQPKAEGVFGTTLFYKGFTFSAFIRYSFGAQVFNTALYEKVENVTQENWTNNMDKRALYDRWQTPGQVAQFKGIGIVDQTDPASSRFVQNENFLSGEGFSLGYQFIGQAWLKKISCRTISIRANMSDVFRISSVKAERSLYYPFAKTVSLSLSATF